MFRSDDEFKKIIRGLHIDIEPNPDHQETLRRQVLTVYEASGPKSKLADDSFVVKTDIWRRIMKSKIAKFAVASIIVLGFTVICHIGFSGNSVNAAEMLEKTMKVNKDYEGWIHINVIYKTVIEDTDEVEGLITGTRHMNTMNGTWIWEDKTGGNLKIHYFSPVENEYNEYDSLKGEVTLNDLNSYPHVDNYPLTIDARIASFKKVSGKDPYNITITQEEEYNRFDILFFENKEEETRVRKEKRHAFANNVSLWVNRETHLIYKSITEIYNEKPNGIVSVMEISRDFKYGKPLINTIYDLGVPEDAVVIDYRKTLEIENVLERLKNRLANLNHYVALMTKTKINDDETMKDSCTLYSKDSCTLHLFAQDDDVWLVNRYPVGTIKYRNRPDLVVPSIKETPENLLSLDINTVLDRIKHAHLWSYFVFDGENFYSNEANPHFPENFDNAQKKQMYDHIRVDVGLLRNIWFGQENYGHNTKTKLITREEKPGEIGLHIEYYTYPPPFKARNEKYYWFNSQRDDMPLERVYRSYLEDGKTVDSETHTTYLDCTQLPDGRWYPTRWRTTTIRFSKENPRKETSEFRLTIHTDIELEEDWFIHPNQKTVF